MNKAEEIIDVGIPTGDEPAEVVHPGKESLHFPASAIAAQLPSILTPASAPPIGRDQFDSIFFSELRVERVRIVRFVADEPGGKLVKKASGKNLFNKCEQTQYGLG